MSDDIHLTVSDDNGIIGQYSIFYLSNDVMIMFRKEPRGEEE